MKTPARSQDSPLSAGAKAERLQAEVLVPDGIEPPTGPNPPDPEELRSFGPRETSAVTAEAIIKHVAATNPHSGARDAFAGMSDLRLFTWEGPTPIPPGDARIPEMRYLHPASSMDVNRYMRAYKKGSDFPPIVLELKAAGTKFSVMDGAHRLVAALRLNVPISAYIGTRKAGK